MSVGDDVLYNFHVTTWSRYYIALIMATFQPKTVTWLTSIWLFIDYVVCVLLFVNNGDELPKL